jgi:phosphatidate cytidylyltransferase
MTAEAPSKWGDLLVRTASAVVLIPAVIACVWVGGELFVGFTALLGCLIAHEWARIVHAGSGPQYVLHMAAGLAGSLITQYGGAGLAVAMIVALAVGSALLVRFGDRPRSPWSYLGIFYVGLPVMALVILRQDPVEGFAAIMWVFLIVWGADILAYFAGRIIGGPKLAPRISPKKTWAGLAGAIVGSALASLVFAHFRGLNGWPALVFLAAGLAPVEQGGDLFESAVKRYYGVKDSGHIIPGHGGIIDRVDGLIAVVIIAGLIGWSRDHGLGAAHGLLLW